MYRKTNKEIMDYINSFENETGINVLDQINKRPKTNRHNGYASNLEKYLFPNDDIDMIVAYRVAMILGISIYDLMKCNENRLSEYLESYDYFKFYQSLKNQFEKADSDNNSLVLVNFPEINEFINSYSELCRDFIDLFKKSATNGWLNGDEREWISFLASVLNATDIISELVCNMEVLHKFSLIYKDEIKKYNVDDIISFDSTWIKEIWRCVDFIESADCVVELDKFAPQWRRFITPIKNKSFDKYDLICELHYGSDDTEILTTLSEINWASNLINVINLAPVNYKTEDKMLLFLKTNEANERRLFRQNVSFSSILPQTFDQWDYLELETGFSKTIIDMYFDAQEEFENITSLDKNENPEEYEDSLLTYVAGAIGFDIETVYELYEKEQEYIENY